MSESALLRAADVSFNYARAREGAGVHADAGATPDVLSGVSADVPYGQILGILGPNGSGKTTLLRLLSGTRRPLAGEVTLDGTALHRMSRRAVARRIAVVPQETQLAFDYTVMEMVLMGRHPHLGLFELEGPHDFDVARGAMRATGVHHLAAREFNTLSGGEKQRVVIAAALAQAADILLLDEPTASLDLAYQLEVADLLTRLNRERGVTIVISTHDLSLAASVCAHLVLMRAGRVVASGPTERVLTSQNILAVYDVHADVQMHAASGHLMVVPVRRSGAR